jgi:YD repeat-containing protein
MATRASRLALATLLLSGFASHAYSQPTRFHLHKETSGSGNGVRRLNITNPEPGPIAIQSGDLKNVAITPLRTVADFDTYDLIPSTRGVIPANSVISVRLWMKKTANWGQFRAAFQLFLNDSSVSFCPTIPTASTDLSSSTLQHFDFSCTTNSAITVNTTDRYYLIAGIAILGSAGSHSVKAELDIEGAMTGNYDSWVDIPTPPPPPPPPPLIANVSPVAGFTGTSVTVTGANFGASPGTVTFFNGVTGSPTNWGTGSVTVPVPATATTGPVQVTTTAGNSNTLTFTVWTTGAIGGTVTQLTGGQPLSGALMEVLQSGVVKASQTTAADGTYGMTGLTSGIYDVRCSLASFVTVLRANLSIGGGGTTIVNVALAHPGTISGLVTQSGGSSPIAGAAVSASQDGVVIASTTTDGTGAYTLAGLAPGTYSADGTAIGYAPQSQSGVAVTENGTATANLSLTAVSPPAVRYVYDELGRLAAAVDLNGEMAKYTYDAVGNITAITRQSANILTLLAFSPHSGPVGTTVTIAGTGFSPIPTNNTVSFGGLGATVVSASATSLVVTVPSGLQAGPVTLTVSVGGSSVNATFTVTAAFDLVLLTPNVNFDETTSDTTLSTTSSVSR